MAASFGPFFDTDSHPPGAVPVPPWRPLAELVEQPEALRARVEQVRRALARDRSPELIQPRVAASVAHLGLVARLLSPALAARVGTGRGAVALAELWWQSALGGAFPLSLPAETGPIGSGVPAPVRALTEAMLAAYPVSPRVLWGNVASSMHAAAGIIVARRPDLGPAVTAALAELLADPVLTGTGSPERGRFRRTSCCLIYRVAALDDPRGTGRAAICGDCVLGRSLRPEHR